MQAKLTSDSNGIPSLRGWKCLHFCFEYCDVLPCLEIRGSSVLLHISVRGDWSLISTDKRAAVAATSSSTVARTGKSLPQTAIKESPLALGIESISAVNQGFSSLENHFR
ncbi:hypothetical protein CDAR_423241 [Caerostris darwini]|uniref:Uncharacterized protein n=1 Tax=Caerostris darwini TaxID=1538125 RepID=A0AAV4UR58_9ARAC|nr:hypothetical protein CDAR_423241 [Caerostris darwini]